MNIITDNDLSEKYTQNANYEIIRKSIAFFY